MPFPLLHEVEPAAGGDAAVGPIYCASAARGGARSLEGVETCYDLWRRTCTQHPEKDALAWREKGPDGKYGAYKTMTYGEADALAAQAAAGLAALGAAVGDRVGICAVNSPEWMLAMQAINRMGYVCVPLYDTLGDAAVAYVAAHAEVRVVLCGASKVAEVAKTAERLAAGGTPLGAAVYWGSPDAAALAALTAAAPRVVAWPELLAAGAAAPREPCAPEAAALCTIMYTSGTTGNPKGVMLTHAAVLAEVAAIRQFFYASAGAEMTEAATQRYFSFLTLAHIFDRVVEEFLIMQAGCIGYYTGHIARMLDDVAAFRPTAFAGVPRVFERIYSGALGKVDKQPPLARLAFRLAMGWKGSLIRAGARPESASAVADLLVFNKFKSALGGECRAIISGGAPLPPHVLEFVQVAMCCPVLQGYGLTESCAASFVTPPYDASLVGTVGPPMPGIQVRLEAVPELGYSPHGAKPQGEVCLRGPALFSGYYKQPELTAEAVDADGFFHTGDIGEFTPAGALRIIDRRKNIFKLSQGEYVAVEAVEAALEQCPLVEQLWLYGSSYQPCLVAVVVPCRAALASWAAAAGGAAAKAEFEDLCGAPEARAHVLQALVAAGKAAKLKGFELPKAVHLEPAPFSAVHLEATPFSVENDLMTPKFSLKRPQLLKHYKAQVDGMYAALSK
ncbi:MAG: hypothetical protein J3K34DRAFT_525246 [Monoraphidium minutum]|nr:MAG: hypothetical protein J3K34DRAFT_525246 [Monoraphidium minutum]